MILLIGGDSHTGKTLLAQRMMERYKIPYSSLDHLKMGLVRGYPACGFTSNDSDDVIADAMWGVVKGMIDTCLENGQHLILEGCYLPPERVAPLVGEEVLAVYLGLSEAYIRQNFDQIYAFENVIERRCIPDGRTVQDLIDANRTVRQACLGAGLPYYEIMVDYEREIDAVQRDICKKILRLHPYHSTDIAPIAQLFYDTVHTVNAGDYTHPQLDAWANGRLDQAAWDASLRAHTTFVAKLCGRIVGFADLDGDYFDRLYVHKDYQRMGIATALADRLEQTAVHDGKTSICTHASITARPFFERRGYRVLREQQVERFGQLLTNFVMEKAFP